MPLPELIEILPLGRPVQAEVTVPGSKSITNRALILAALAEGETTLTGALWSEDTQVMVECLQELGFMVNVELDPNEPCNRTVTVYGKGGTVPRGGTAAQPLELFVGNAGTAARFLAALVCLGEGVYRLHGIARMHERPQAELFSALRQLGYRVEPEAGNDHLPARIHGGRPAGSGGRRCTVSIESSSQFASALLLCATAGGWDVKIHGENLEESPYVAMTSALIKTFPRQGGAFQVEPDASSGGYFLAAGLFSPGRRARIRAEQTGAADPAAGRAGIRVANWPTSGWQIDQGFAEVLRRTYTRQLLQVLESGIPDDISTAEFNRRLRQVQPNSPISRRHDLGDSIMMAIVCAPLQEMPFRFVDLGRLRVQECERVAALRAELTRCGAKVVEEGDSLTVYPSALHGAEIETYNDHRMAMCFAILGLKVPGIKIKNPACVKKTFPNFFQKLAGPPPKGLGATIRDARSNRPLSWEDLFAA